MKPEILKYIPVAERRHYMKCTECGGYFDMRDLQDVYNHLHKSKDAKLDYSIPAGKTIAFTKRKEN